MSKLLSVCKNATPEARTRFWKTKVVPTVVTIALMTMMCVGVICDDDVFATAGTAAGSLVTKLKTLAEAILPLMIVISGVSLLFTRDERKLATEKKILISLCLAFALILVADKVLPTIKDVMGL